MEDSSGFVTTVSTVSGLAPTYVVIIITYGKLIFGNKSVVILVKDTTPNTSTIITDTNTVYGFFTLNFEIIRLSFQFFNFLINFNF